MPDLHLTRYFIVTSLVAFVIIVAALGYFVPKLLMDDLRGEYEHDNINYANFLANQFWVDDFAPLLATMTGKPSAEIQAAPQIIDLNRRVLTVLRGTSVFKVNVYDLKGVAIYSTDLKVIGEDESNKNGGVIAGLRGKTSSELVHRDHFSALEGEILDRDLVHTYVPQFDSLDGQVTGVFEIYSDATQFLAETRNAQRHIIGAVLVLLSLLYLALFIIVHRAQRTMQKQNLQRARVEETLKFVAQGGWTAGGSQVFPALVEFLARTLGMDYVLIDKLSDQADTVETVALYARDGVVPNMHYGLTGTPCENVMGKKLCVYPRDVQKLFPLDTSLVDMRVESYIGIPLWDSKHKTIGLIACMHSEPLTDAASIQAVLQVVATRAAAELERKQADDELRESEFRWKFAIEGSGDGLWDWNVPESTVFFSTRWKNMLGFAEDDIGRGLDEWSKRVHPDDLAQVMADVQAHLDGTTPLYVNEHRVSCKDGSWKWILDRGLVVSRDDTGKPLRVIGTHSDITERKRQQDLINEHNTLLTRQKVELEATMGRIRRLEGLLSICMQCKKIRNENNAWLQLEKYIGENSDATFSHGLCPECLNKEMKKLD